MIALWMLFGCALVTAALFLPGHSSDLWPNINSAGLALLVYLAALLGAFSRRKDLSPRRKNFVIALAVIAVAGGVFAWKQMEDHSQWQRRQFGKIATVIGRGIYTFYIPDSLLIALDDYHRQKGNTRMTLGDVYRKRFPPGKVGDVWSTLRPTGMPDPPDDVFLAEISDTHVVLVARHPWYRGKNAAFANYHGPTGTIQVRATLTEKGLEYVTEN